MGKGKRCKSVRRASENNRGNFTVQDKSITNSLFRRKTVWTVIALGTIFFSVSDVVAESQTASNPKSSLQLPLVGLPKENKSGFAKPVDVSIETNFVPPSELNDPLQAAKLNLLCAKGLKGAEDLDIDKCLNTLQKWAEWVKHETDRNLHKFKENPKEYYNSEAYFRMALLVTVLQQDFGVKYNPDLIPKDGLKLEDLRKPFTDDSRNVFLHGLLTGKNEGTCASMPVLYLTVGRLLGYPLKLVSTKCHLFLRWEDNKERINLEGTAPGLSVKPDEFYKKWPFDITPEEDKYQYYLKSLSSLEEYIVFLEIRAGVLQAVGQKNEVKRIYEKILEYQPNHPHVREYIAKIDSNKMQENMSIVQGNSNSYRQKQTESIGLIDSAQSLLTLETNKQLADEDMKKFDKRDTRFVRSNLYRSALNEPYFVHKAEMEHIKRMYQMKINEMNNWKTQLETGNGSPVTQEEINTLMGINPDNSVSKMKLPKEIVERQKEEKYERLRREPGGEREIVRQEELELTKRRQDEQMSVERNIISARNMRIVAEETFRLEQKTLQSKLYGTELKEGEK